MQAENKPQRSLCESLLTECVKKVHASPASWLRGTKGRTGTRAPVLLLHRYSSMRSSLWVYVHQHVNICVVNL